MKLKANSALDMLSDLSFFEASYEDIISASRSRISLIDPNGNRQDYLGSFNYDYSGDLDWSSSSLKGFTQFDGSSVYWKATGLTIPGTVYNDFAESDDGVGLLIYALQGADSITGSNSDDVLYGGAGNDKINGRGGADFIWGGSGKDSLTGGSGPDTFLFSSSLYTGTTPQSASIINDFSPNQGDQIAMEVIDELEEPLTTSYVQAFSGVAGQYTSQEASNGILLSLDSTGDGIADVFLTVRGIKSFDSSYVYDDFFA